jgi:hypothetical protein
MASKYWHALLFTMTPLSATAQIVPPTVTGLRPASASSGEAVESEIRGSGLEGITGILFEGEGIAVEKVSGTKARVVVAKGAAPGPRRFRVVGPNGVSNAGIFYVGRPLPTVRESEPNGGFANAQKIAAPSAIVGEIKPGADVDLFAVDLRRGETFVAEAIAARSGSDLDALVTILDADGRALAEADDTFGRDAVAVLAVPRDGRYFVQVQDAEGPRRDGNVENALVRPYRLEVGRLPLVTAVFPLGARRGEAARFRLLGSNLDRSEQEWTIGQDASWPENSLILSTPLGPTHPWPLIADDLPATAEAEPDDEVDEAAMVAVPTAIDGRFGSKGDTDVFRLVARPGQAGQYAIRVLAARGGSPADPVIALLDAKGAITAENDDALGRDAMVEAKIDAKDGAWIAVREKFGRGGDRFAYRIEVERLDGRLAIAADLGLHTVPRRGALAIPLTVDRRGVAGSWTVAADGLPDGVRVEPLTLGPGANQGVIAVAAVSDAPLGPFLLRLVARPDAGAAPETPIAITYQDSPTGRDGPGATGPIRLTLAVAEPAPLGIAIEPAEVEVEPGASVPIRVVLDRRGDAAKKAVKIRLLGPTDSFEPVAESKVASDANEATLTLKARPDAAHCQGLLTVRTWFDGVPEIAGVAAQARLVVPPKK